MSGEGERALNKLLAEHFAKGGGKLRLEATKPKKDPRDPYKADREALRTRETPKEGA